MSEKEGNVQRKTLKEKEIKVFLKTTLKNSRKSGLLEAKYLKNEIFVKIFAHYFKTLKTEPVSHVDNSGKEHYAACEST